MYDLIKAETLHSNRAITAHDNGWLSLIMVAQPAKLPQTWSSTNGCDKRNGPAILHMTRILCIYIYFPNLCTVFMQIHCVCTLCVKQRSYCPARFRRPAPVQPTSQTIFKTSIATAFVLLAHSS